MVAAKKGARTFNPGDVVFVSTKKPGARGYLDWQPGEWYKAVVHRIIPPVVFPRRYGPDQIEPTKVAVVKVMTRYYNGPVFGSLWFESGVAKNRRDSILSEAEWIETIEPAIKDRAAKRRAVADTKAAAKRTNAEAIAERIVLEFARRDGSRRAIIAEVLLAESNRPAGYARKANGSTQFTYPRLTIKEEVYEYDNDAD